ncbi:hypothetical protein P879_02587 [Paragonimus westermani]|uniref:Cyclic nucleotide-binding domain-containing protein n=1 Tax=Paragonimus westermani TaxID=34504 RepID=A0A8T0DPI2_9TREM|nr:hypothetical protein P879_02587 [Paragonimus westermani]
MFKIYDLNGREVSRQKAAASRSSQEARISCIFFDRPKCTETHRPGSRVTSTWEQDLQRYLSTGGRHITIPNRRTSERRTKSADPLSQHRALVEMLSAGVGTNKESEQPLTPNITVRRATLPDVPDIEFKADLDDDDQNVISTPSDECSTKAISEENELPSTETSEVERGKLLRLRMAEIFSKAVDNEGMGISTFAYLDDVEEEDQLNVIVSDSDGPLSSRSSTYTKNRVEKKENEVTDVSYAKDRISLLRKILLSALLLKAALNIIRPSLDAFDDVTKQDVVFLVIVSVSRKNKLTGEAFEESVAILKAGQSFGELSLIYGGKRSATIVCNSPVELLVMSRTAFASIFMSATDETKVEHLVFLRAHPLIPATVVDKLLQTDEKTFLFTYFRSELCICKLFSVYLFTATKFQGLETVAFASYGGTNSVALLSDGSECIAVNKKFFVKHCPTNFLNWLRRQVS